MTLILFWRNFFFTCWLFPVIWWQNLGWTLFFSFLGVAQFQVQTYSEIWKRFLTERLRHNVAILQTEVLLLLREKNNLFWTFPASMSYIFWKTFRSIQKRIKSTERFFVAKEKKNNHKKRCKSKVVLLPKEKVVETLSAHAQFTF